MTPDRSHSDKVGRVAKYRSSDALPAPEIFFLFCLAYYHLFPILALLGPNYFADLYPGPPYRYKNQRQWLFWSVHGSFGTSTPFLINNVFDPPPHRCQLFKTYTPTKICGGSFRLVNIKNVNVFFFVN